jgi:[ribosomal protein S5]-alanine N-acetyltransferase
MTPIPALEGPRVRLRTFTPGDIDDAYIGWLNDPEVVRLSNQRFRTHDRASCEAFYASLASASSFVSMRLKEGDRAIGTMTAHRNPHHGTVDVGIMVGARDMWGSGIGQEAWDLLVEQLLTEPGIRKLTAGTLDCNIGMIRLMERSGMVLEATRRAQELVDGAPEDIVYYARFAG